MVCLRNISVDILYKGDTEDNNNNNNNNNNNGATLRTSKTDTSATAEMPEQCDLQQLFSTQEVY